MTPSNKGSHEFHDTKHRRVTCSIVASSRYGEYFPDTISNPQVSSKVTIDIPCSARPLPPKVLYVVPTFDWQQESAGQGATTRERRVGLRVYLDRPWYSSGDGERLSVRMAMAPVIVQPPNGGGGPPPPGPRPFDQPNIDPSPPQDIQDADAPFVTQWGTDPAFRGNSIASPFTPLPRHFPNAKSTEFQLNSDGITLGEAATYNCAHATFDVAFEPPDPSDPDRSADPSRDPHNGHWYCDIEIDAGTPYFPFLRLALARFQPSGQFWDPEGLIFFDMRFSSVTLVDFVQLAPGRTLNIVPEATDPALLHVVITGSSFVPNEALGNRTRVPSSVIVGIEMNVAAEGAALWIPMSSTDLSHASASPADPGATTWRGDVRLPFAQGSKPMRLTIREYETLPADPSSRDLAGTTLVRRLVFAATVELTSPSYNFTTVDFPGATSTLLQGLNDKGQIVGAQRDANGIYHSLLTDTHSFSTFDPSDFDAGASQEVSSANGINGKGEIVGIVLKDDIPNPESQAYINRGDSFSLYKHPNADPSKGTDFEGINDAGVRVGTYRDHADNLHGFIQDDDTTTLLETSPNMPANGSAWLFDINNGGRMVGGYFDVLGDIQHGLFTDGTNFTTVDFPGSDTTWLNGINNLGQMVGAYFDNASQVFRGFLTDGNSFTTIDFPDLPKGFGTFPTGIDDKGRIVGYYGAEAGLEGELGKAAPVHGFLATPVSKVAR